MIADLLDVSRITSGKLRLDIQPVDPAAMIDSPERSKHAAARQKTFESNAYWIQTPTTVSGDPSTIRQVMWNLVNKRRQIHPQGRQHRSHASASIPDSEIAVSDNGRESVPSFCRTSSTDSNRATQAPRASTAVLGWDLRLRSNWSRCTAARSRLPARAKAKARRLSFVCRWRRYPSAAMANPANIRQSPPAGQLVNSRRP